jgi:tetratricopeptide (TPR) repeat protein
MKTLRFALSILSTRHDAALGRFGKRVVHCAFPVILAGALSAQGSFDYTSVQRDILMGIGGNGEALKRGMEVCEKTLAEHPDHPGALVFHGIGLLAQSQGNPEIFPKALSEMDRGAELDPQNLGVRIPRGSVLIVMSRQMPDSPWRQAQIEKARADFQYAFDTQKEHLSSLGTHPLGELLQNLGDIYSRLDKPDEAQKYYALIQSMLPESVYSRRAAQWLTTKQTLPIAQSSCVGCHIGGKR